MLKSVAILAATIALTACQAATAADWHTDYGTALKQTRSDDRPMLVVIDEPGNQELSVSKEVLDQADGKTYDLCHVDASTKYGKKVAKAFKTKQLPYVAFIDKGGKVILHSETGKLTKGTFTHLQTKYRTGTKPVRHVAAKPISTVSRVIQSPVNSLPSFQSSQPYFPSASPRPYCAKCQRGY